MTKAQAVYVRARFHSTEGWDELAERFPTLVAALDALPDETLMQTTVNVILRGLFEDAKKEAIACVLG